VLLNGISVNRKDPAWRRRRLPAIYGCVAGYEDVNDAERLAREPAMRAIVGRVGLGQPAASTSRQMDRFETGWLATEALLERVRRLLTRPVDRPPRKPQVFHASFTYRAQSWTKPLAVGEQAAIGGDFAPWNPSLSRWSKVKPER
jgi:hypothetical protein